MATHFPYGSERYKQLWKLANSLFGAHGEWVKLFLDLNGTCIYTHQYLLYSIGRIIISMKSYAMPGNTHAVEDRKSEERETLFETEAVLNCTRLLTTQVQYETSFTGASRPLIQHTLMNSHHFSSISVIDITIITKIPTVPRREKPVAEISLIGKETLIRAQLEAERCFCENDYEVVSSAPVVKSFHDMITSKIDIRNIRSQQMSADERFSGPNTLC